MTRIGMWITNFAVILLSCLELGDSARFLLTVPKQPHYDTKYTAIVSASGIYQKESISLEYRGLKDNSRVINSTVLNFEFDEVKNWTVTFPWTRMEKLQETAMTLTMSTLFKEEKKTLYFSKASGYIFIQTDKPIYTPRQTVKFRIIAVDEYQRLAKYPLKVDIKNDKLIVVDRMRYSAEDAFKGQEFELPRETPPGNWTISANYEGMSNVQSYTHTVSFEVKEYVLPRFSATIKISKDVITKSTNWITINVTAKYVYGERVLGSAEMQLGIWDPKKGLQLLPGKYSGNLKNGEFRKNIRISRLIPAKLIERENRRLYINVNVTENGTMENDTIVDTSTFIAHPYYEISYAHSKTHFKPGFPYTLHTRVRARSGRPASWLKLWVVAEYMDKEGKRVGGTRGYYALNNEGKNVQDFRISKDAHKIRFKTFVLDFKAGTNNDNELVVPMLESPNQQYIHISLITPIRKYLDGSIKLQYTKPNRYVGFQAPIEQITVQVIARGQILHSLSVVRQTTGQSMVYIPKFLYTEVTPSMRIVASFYHKGGIEDEFVIDSLRVKTDEVCVEELKLQQPNGIFASPMAKKPKDRYNLMIKGGRGMHVGLVAVDKAVFLLNDAHTLTRDSMFEQLASHDQGKGSGDGQDMKEVLANSGLLHMFLDSTEIQNEPTAFAVRRKNNGDMVVSKARGRLPIQGARRPWVTNVKELPGVMFDLARSTTGTLLIDLPPQTVRKYFPESWLFEEHILPSKSGQMTLNLTLPDSITTWSFMAVGFSSDRGVCVSSRLEQKVQKLFFVDVRLPYKVTRLEEIKVKVAIYNYHTAPITINVVVSGSDGLCFSSNHYRGTKQNSTSFKMNIRKESTRSRDIKVIPLNNGELTLRVDAYTMNDRDIVERQIYVVAEGQRLKKSLTFVLDPEAKHAQFNTARKGQRITSADTATIKTVINKNRKMQKTKVDLAMPKEVVRGTEKCKISAFGDLMGDILDHAVVKSKSLMDQMVQNAEEVLGDLGPTIHALLYANQSRLMDEALEKRAQKFVRQSVMRLLRYRKDKAFGLTPKSPEGTWLTAAVLKTLCHSSKLAFIDKELLIDHGFFWLLEQVTENETLIEKDWRLAKDSWDYQVMLSAEVLIAILECGRSDFEAHVVLITDMAFFLEDNIEFVEEPMVLAKVAYALTLFEKESPATNLAVKKLESISLTNQQGQVYWSSEPETNEVQKVPFWYHQGAKASAIEATAYALLVFLNHPGTKVDAIADWLVSQRNDHGIFISALDSMAAIQALSSYSLIKQGQGLKVDLSCQVKSDKARNYTHSFKFTEKNAIRPESLNNVPVGHTLDVLTRGQGLGQMQINVEYNIPIDPNEKCSFNVTIEVKKTEVNFYSDMIYDPLCMSCSWGCRPIEKNTSDINDTFVGNETAANVTDDMNITTTEPPTKPTSTTQKAMPSVGRIIETVQPRRPVRPLRRSRPGRKGKFTWPSRRGSKSRKNPFGPSFKPLSKQSTVYKVTGHKQRRRRPRSVRQHSSASRRSICVKVCLQYVEIGSAGHTRIEIDMLTGYLPVTSDVERLNEFDDVVDAWFSPEKDSLIVIFKQVNDEEQSCIAFRAVDHEEVGRPTPATVLVTEVGNPAPSCALEYQPPSGMESLQVYCADFSNINRGECRCYSGLCSSCAPNTHNEIMEFSETKDLVCRSDIGYQLQVQNVQGRDQWVEIEAKVLSLNKTGSHKLKPKDTIKMISPSSCACPTFFGTGKEVLYMISADVEKMVDRHGNIIHHYLLDEQSVFLRVGEKNITRTSSSRMRYRRRPPSVPYVYMNQAFRKCAP